MSQPPKNTPQIPPEKPGVPRIDGKLLLIWVGVIALILSLFYMGGGGGQLPNQLTISQVLKYADEEKIYSLKVEQDASSGGGYFRVTGSLSMLDTGKDGQQRITEGDKFSAAGYLRDDDFKKLRSAVAPDRYSDRPASTMLTMMLTSILPILLMGGLFVFFAYRFFKSANRNALGFAKSRAKMLSRDKERASFKDVAGCDEAKEDVQEIVEFLRDPKRFQKIGGRIPKGILLVGPPGTGKTLIARAVAGEADVPFFTISGSDFVEMFVGVGAARVRDMFEQARKNAPCIVFIDEIDAVGRQRGAGVGGGHDEREQTLNSLLVEMDGFEGHEGIIIIAATNRPDVLDSALLRPGRFDRQVYVDLPDIHGREEILKVHAKKIKLATVVDLERAARATPGFSGADLANLLNESALLAARKNKKEVEAVEIEEARDKISFGRERRRLMDDEDRRMTAYHEAGHAIVQATIDDGLLPLHKVTIIPRGRALGMAMFLPKKDILGQSKKQLLNRICTAMAGRIGEEIVTGDFSNGAASDIKQATTVARHMVCDWGMSDLGPVAFGENQEHIFLGREITRSQNYSDDTARRIDTAIHDIVQKQYLRAQTVLKEHAQAHKVVAEALLEYETLDGAHVHEALKYGEIRTPVVYRPLTRRERDADTAPVVVDSVPLPTPDAAPNPA
ncbi:MAG: ATP-dependent zinc metalloprotease FtsH [Puniceicoccales bacterium]|jgi:cell division protease FtsH|nr:ATP-dependent zinc metalloprotease FtsH [Puniceicoccales bacterium]